MPAYTLVLATPDGYHQWFAGLAAGSFVWDTAVANATYATAAVLDARGALAVSWPIAVGVSGGAACAQLQAPQSGAPTIGPVLGSSGGTGLSAGLIAGIAVTAVAVVFVLGLFVSVVVVRRRRRGRLAGTSLVFPACWWPEYSCDTIAAGAHRLSDKVGVQSLPHAGESPFADPRAQNPFDDPPKGTVLPSVVSKAN